MQALSRARSSEVARHIVLVGAGHAHVEVLRRFRLRPEPGLRLTIIMKAGQTPYSGMFPGFIAGHYTKSDINIQTGRLADFDGCTTVLGCAVGLDADHCRVLLDGGRSVAGDVISIDVGAVTDVSDAPKSNALLAPVKPLDELEARWPEIEKRILSEPTLRIAVVGAGAAGIELALAIRYRMQQAGKPAVAEDVVIFEKSDRILSGFADSVRRRLTKILAGKRITIRTGFAGFPSDRDAGNFSVLIWAAGVSPAPWLAASSLGQDERGFIAVNRHLQSVSHPDFFAGGDAAGMILSPRPKSGVIAVRQGPLLAENLARRALGRRC